MTIIRWQVMHTDTRKTFSIVTSNQGDEEMVWQKFLHAFRDSALKPARKDYKISVLEMALV